MVAGDSKFGGREIRIEQKAGNVVSNIGGGWCLPGVPVPGREVTRGGPEWWIVLFLGVELNFLLRWCLAFDM